MGGDEAVLDRLDSKVVFREISIVYLKQGEYQPRRDFPEEGLVSLAETIKRDGILEPLLVRPLNDQDYEIIAGERRWRAAQRALLQTVPCLIKSYTDEQAARIALIENTHRVNLDPIAESLAMSRIIEEFGYTHEELAAVVGKPRSVITNLLRFLKLDNRVQEFLRRGDLTEAHGKLLAGLAPEQQYPLALEAVNKNWTTRWLEAAIKNQSRRKKSTGNQPKDINLSKIEQQLSDKLGHRVTFNVKRDRSGSINILFHNYDSLEGVLEKLGYESEAD